MQSAIEPALLETRGVVQSVDVQRRELKLLSNNTVQAFDVPPDSAILLRGERVKMRLLQPMDEARIVYTRGTDALIARSIEIKR
jgi:hypothetical protein